MLGFAIAHPNVRGRHSQARAWEREKFELLNCWRVWKNVGVRYRLPQRTRYAVTSLAPAHTDQ
jgi:hypothetical protein